MSSLFDGLTTQERRQVRAICIFCGLQRRDFTVRVERETAGAQGSGRRLANVLYKPSRRYRTYRAGPGNRWMSSFEEDIKTHCYFSLFGDAPAEPRAFARATGKM